MNDLFIQLLIDWISYVYYSMIELNHQHNHPSLITSNKGTVLIYGTSQRPTSEQEEFIIGM